MLANECETQWSTPLELYIRATNEAKQILVAVNAILLQGNGYDYDYDHEFFLCFSMIVFLFIICL